MREVVGNLWDYHNEGEWIAITTNPIINAQGKLVMGRGVALQAALKYPEIKKILADLVKEHGNHVVALPQFKIVSFPVKRHWRDEADLDLIERSAKELVEKTSPTRHVYLPRPGCGNGRLSWVSVKPILQSILDDRFVVVSLQDED